MRFREMKHGVTYDIRIQAVVNEEYSDPLLEIYTVPNYNFRT